MIDTRYRRVERNIYDKRGKLYVSVTRRKTNGATTLRAGPFFSLAEAVKSRDVFEKSHKASKPGCPASKPGTPVERQAARRAARRAAGLCAECGAEPPAPGLKACRTCRDINNTYRREKRQKQKEQQHKEGINAES